jgi:hypothetical protein
MGKKFNQRLRENEEVIKKVKGGVSEENPLYIWGVFILHPFGVHYINLVSIGGHEC